MPMDKLTSLTQEFRTWKRDRGRWRWRNSGEKNCVRAMRGSDMKFSIIIRGSQELMTETDKSRNSNGSVLFKNVELNSRRKS